MSVETIILLYLCFWLALAGAVLGSFIDCAVWRWANGGTMFKGRSHCAACGHVLTARDLVPVFSYLFARGRCRHCGEKIPAECLWAEIAGALVFVCLGARFGVSAELCQWLVLGALLLSVSLTDAARRLIPDKLLAAMAVNRAVWVLLLGQPVWDSVKTALVSLCAGPLPLLALALVMDKVLGRDTMGGGDIKLLMALALYLTWPQMLLTLLAGCLLGIVGAAVGKQRGAIPFGPYLAAAGVAAVCFGGPLLDWYLGLLG